jgi:CBS domain-containing protein
MKCDDLMSLNLEWVPATASVAEAAQIMRDHSMGFLLVSGDEPGVPIGVITDRDLALRCCAENRRPDEVRVDDVATKQVVTCGAGEHLSFAEKLMIASETSRLVIVDGIGRAVGVLSLTDILLHDWGRRAVKTARGILAREANGPHQPIEAIKLTPSTPEEEERAARMHSELHGGFWDTTVKMFP